MLCAPWLIGLNFIFFLILDFYTIAVFRLEMLTRLSTVTVQGPRIHIVNFMKKHISIVICVFAFLIAYIFVQYNYENKNYSSFDLTELSTNIKALVEKGQVKKADFFDQNLLTRPLYLKRSLLFSNSFLLVILCSILCFKNKLFFVRTCCNHSLNNRLSCNFLRLQILKSKAHPPTCFSF